MNIEDFNKIITSRSWQFTYDRKMSYQRMRLFNYGYCKQFSDFFGVKINSEIYRIKNETVSVYYEKNDHEKAFNEIRLKLSGSDSLRLVEKIKTTIENFYSEFIKDVKSAPTDYSKFSNKELADIFDDFSRQNEKISLPTWLLYLHIEEILTDEIKKRLLTKIGDQEKVNEIISAIATPIKVLPLDAYNKDLYKIVLLPISQQKTGLKKIAKKYINWGVYDVNFDVPDLLFHESKINRLTVDEAKSKINEIEERYKLQIKKYKKAKKYWKNDKILTAFIDLYSLYANFKDWKNFYREQSSYKMKLLFIEIAHRLSLTPKEVSFLTEEETKAALLHNLKINKVDIEKRIINSALVFLDGTFHIITDSASLEVIDAQLKMTDVLTLHGSIAFKGIVIGAVKIIASIKDFDKVKEGDILVASTTRPDYLPFMKMSAGFITNEGGMLSHAAIMARELKKPCVIGTKIATKVLKDGDMVEVDAEKGIVTILQSKK